MHRIDTVGATDGNQFKASPLPATRLGADWHNAVQEEIANVIEAVQGGGAALDKADNTQLLTAIVAVVDRAFASGQFSHGANGNGRWRRFPIGGGNFEIEQRGTVTGPFTETDGARTITFPIPFPLACDSLMLTAVNSDGSLFKDGWAQRISLGTDSATWRVQWTGSGTFTGTIDAIDWLAKGS